MTNTKKWLIAAACLILAGSLIFLCVMIGLKWDFSKLSTNEYVTNNHTVSENFDSIFIDTDTADIEFAPSGNREGKVICHEHKKVTHTVEVKDGTLTVRVTDTRKWYEHIGINFATAKITVYLPDAEYASLRIKESTGDIEIPEGLKFGSIDLDLSTGDINLSAASADSIKINATTGSVSCSANAKENIDITTSTGNITVKNTSAASLSLSVSTGRITVRDVSCDGNITVSVSTGSSNLTNVKCKRLISSGNTGDISLSNVIGAEAFSIERSTGDVRLDGSDAADITIKTDTGDVIGTLLTPKIFTVRSDTGKESYPDSAAGGKCKISTDTGDIIISIK